MLYALRQPLNFLALLVGFVAAILARGVVQAWLARALGARDFELRARSRPDLRRHGDAFGAVAALLGGTGWGSAAPVEGLLGRYVYGRARGRPAATAAAVLAAGPLTAGVVGLVALLGYRVAGGPVGLLRVWTPYDTLHGDLPKLDLGPRLLFLVGVAALAVAIIALVPVPPLDGGRLLFALAPTTHGWQRVRHYAEQNWGVGLLLVLLIIPLGGRGPVLLALVDGLGEPLMHIIGR